MKRKILAIALLVSAFSLTTFNYANAQCKRFTKKNCLPKLTPYIYNGQLNSATLSQGDIAELNLTFYPDQDYRIFVCSDPILGNVHFKLFDKNQNLIYDNETTDYLPFWDFSTNQSLDLILRVYIPEDPDNNLDVKEGCVSIIVGFKEKKEQNKNEGE
jgi:hypothetical protein